MDVINLPVNPWSSIPQRRPYVLECDLPYIKSFNRTRAKDSTRIHTDLLPEPYFGNLNAAVVVLLLNPGFSAGDELQHQDSKFAAAIRSSYSSPDGTSHIHLGSESNGAGNKWWRRTCKALLEEMPQIELANRLLSVEFSAYHARAFGHAELRLPSQDFSFAVVRRAMSRNALIVCMRGKHLWQGAVPELATYPNRLELKNPRSSALSKGNLEGYESLLAALREGRSRENAD